MAGVGVAFSLFVPVLLSTGCPGSLENPEDFEDVATGPQPLVDPCNGLLTKKCALANCHDAESSSIDLTLQGREERTVDKPGVTCPGNYIDTASPEASLIYSKCAVDAPTCGSPMPLGRQPLSDEELSCLLGYIQSLGGGATGSAASSSASGSSASSSASGSASSSAASGSGGAGVE